MNKEQMSSFSQFLTSKSEAFWNNQEQAHSFIQFTQEKLSEGYHEQATIWNKRSYELFSSFFKINYSPETRQKLIGLLQEDKRHEETTGEKSVYLIVGNHPSYASGETMAVMLDTVFNVTRQEVGLPESVGYLPIASSLKRGIQGMGGWAVAKLYEPILEVGGVKLLPVDRSKDKQMQAEHNSRVDKIKSIFKDVANATPQSHYVFSTISNALFPTPDTSISEKNKELMKNAYQEGNVVMIFPSGTMQEGRPHDSGRTDRPHILQKAAPLFRTMDALIGTDHQEIRGLNDKMDEGFAAMLGDWIARGKRVRIIGISEEGSHRYVTPHGKTLTARFMRDLAYNLTHTDKAEPGITCTINDPYTGEELVAKINSLRNQRISVLNENILLTNEQHEAFNTRHQEAINNGTIQPLPIKRTIKPVDLDKAMKCGSWAQKVYYFARINKEYDGVKDIADAIYTPIAAHLSPKAAGIYRTEK